MTPKRFKAVCTETGKVLSEQNCKAFKHYGHFYFEPLSGQEICQSTGLTDARGQEVYEGDVLLDDKGQYFTVFWLDGCFYLRNGGYIAEEISSGHQIGRIGYGLKKLIVIGNRWQPAAELQARAEAVSKQ